jgi:hypothetical protein
MAQKSNQQIVHLNALIEGRIICGKIAFSPAPLPGVFAELAKFEAQRLLAHVVEEVEEDILAGRL